jgi:sterol desaturase/sphingolipid hydroxylase (fatty acid hydroxylase superfamily)
VLRAIGNEALAAMRLSKLGYYLDFFLSGALIAAFAVSAAMLPTWTMMSWWVAYAVAGCAAWTFIEYTVHRWLYHSAPYFRDVHDAHHAEPNAHIGAPPVICIALIFALFFAPLATANFTAASGVTTGILIGYMAYMLTHHAAHAWQPVPGSWLYEARRHHALHHFRSEECNFGITTSLWDHVFRTALKPPRKASVGVSPDA